MKYLSSKYNYQYNLIDTFYYKNADLKYTQKSLYY